MEILTFEVMACIFIHAPLAKKGKEHLFLVALESSKFIFLSARKIDLIIWTLRKIAKQNLDPYQIKLLLPDIP